MSERRFPGPIPERKINGQPVVPNGAKLLSFARGQMTSSDHLTIFVPGKVIRNKRESLK